MHWIVCNWNKWLTLFEWWIHFILECLRLFVSCCWVANLKHTRISYVQLNKASTSQIIIYHFFLSLQILLIKRVFFHFRQMIKKFELTPYKSTIKKKKTRLNRLFPHWLCSEWQNNCLMTRQRWKIHIWLITA